MTEVSSSDIIIGVGICICVGIAVDVGIGVTVVDINNVKFVGLAQFLKHQGF